MSILTRPILEINLENLLENYNLLVKISSPATPAAVVKNDSYGLSANIIAKFLYDKAGCRNFFVAHACEGEKFINDIPQATIYVLQGVGNDSINIFNKYTNMIPVISSVEMLEYWRKNGICNIKPAIQVETGLNRLGFREKELQSLSKNDLQLFSLVMSHLACADEKNHFMNTHQIDTFSKIKNIYFPDVTASLSASDGVFLGPEFNFDMVRLGAAMYGINTTPYRISQMKNVITVKAPVLQIAELPEGEYVGYSATYRANSNRRIAIVSIGYGDGIPRSLSNIGKVFFKDKEKINEARILGRVSMDNIICDITGIENIQVGDLAYLSADFYTLDDVAKDAGTISYEIMSRLGKNPRFEKKYIGL